MDLWHELFGTFGGWLIILIGLFMIVVMPLSIRWAIRHDKGSPAARLDDKAHPDQHRH
jgi:hypothetical protein